MLLPVWFALRDTRRQESRLPLTYQFHTPTAPLELRRSEYKHIF